MSLNYGLVAGYHFNNDVTDFSGNGNDGTPNNVTYVNDKDGNPSSAGSFNGTDSDVDTNITQSGGTISLVTSFNTSDSGSTQSLIGGDEVANSGPRSFQFRLDSSGKVRFIAFIGGNDYQLVSSSTYNDGNFHTATATYDGSTIRLYVDNSEVASQSQSGTLDTGANILIGNRTGVSDYFNGKIDEVRIYNRVLTQYEISQLYYGYDTEANQVGILNEGLEAAYHMEDTTDWSGNGNTLTFNGTTLTTDKNGVADKARSFNGSSDYITSSYNGIGGTGARSISFNMCTSQQKQQGICRYGEVNTGEKYTIRIDNNNNYAIRVEVSGGYLVSSTNVCDGNWHHVVVVFPENSTNVTEHLIYVDGVLESVGDSKSQTMNTSTTNNFKIGGSFLHSLYEGVLDEVRIYSRALTDIEVYMLYLGYDSEDTAIETLNEGLVYGSHFNSGTATDYSGNGNDGTFSGSPLATVDKNGDSAQALEFDGNDYIEIPYKPLNLNEMSAIIWAKTTATTTRQTYISLWDDNDKIFFIINQQDDGIVARILSNDIRTGDYPDTEWHCYILNWKNGEVNLLIDAINNGSYVQTGTTPSSSGSNVYIGQGVSSVFPNYEMQGKLDEPRIYNRGLFQDEVIELTYGYDNPSMVEITIPSTIFVPTLFNFGGL